MGKEQLKQIKNESSGEAAEPVMGMTQEEKRGVVAGLQKCLAKFIEMPKKKILIFSGVLVAVLSIGAVLKLTIFKTTEKSIYEVAIMVRSQENSDKEEDQRTSLKAGDVLVTQKDGHKWSKTESISYLILKMSLTEEQAQKLTQAEEREIPDSELSEEEKNRIEEEKKRAKDEDREYREEPRIETLRAREYMIDLNSKKFEGFSANDLLSGQPYSDMIFDWGVVSKKKSVLKEK